MYLRQDLATRSRLGLISGIAVVVGLVCAGVALVLLRLIDGFTNLFFYHQLAHALTSTLMRHSIMTEKVARRGHPISH